METEIWEGLSKGTLPLTCGLCWGRVQQRNRVMERASSLALAVKLDSPVPPCMFLELFELLPGAGAQSE